MFCPTGPLTGQCFRTFPVTRDVFVFFPFFLPLLLFLSLLLLPSFLSLPAAFFARMNVGGQRARTLGSKHKHYKFTRSELSRASGPSVAARPASPSQFPAARLAALGPTRPFEITIAGVLCNGGALLNTSNGGISSAALPGSFQ